jgi:hypothetical protein
MWEPIYKVGKQTFLNAHPLKQEPVDHYKEQLAWDFTDAEFYNIANNRFVSIGFYAIESGALEFIVQQLKEGKIVYYKQQKTKT